MTRPAGRVGGGNARATASSPRIEAFGDSALLVTFADEIDLEANARVHALAAALDRRSKPAADTRAPDPAGLGEVLAAHASLLVPYDPETLDEAAARRLVDDALEASLGPKARSAVTATGGLLDGLSTAPVEIPVRYGGPDGPDLARVAALHGLRPEEVIELHASTTYRVLALGFTPGFAYLGVLPAVLVTPRRDTPRPHVPAGSVAIAGRQTAVYPLETPGGWHILGRTDLALWDLGRDPPALLAPGATVRFRPIRD